MENPLKRPNGEGVSMTKLTAVAAMLWPVLEPFITGQKAIPMDAEFVSGAAPYVFLGLIAFFLRRAIPDGGKNLDKLLDSYQQAFGDRARLQARVRELEARELQENEDAHG